jgi:hypothetical protein
MRPFKYNNATFAAPHASKTRGQYGKQWRYLSFD